MGAGKRDIALRLSGAICVMLVTAFAAATAVLAQAPAPTSGKRFALVIGNANYPDASSPVPTAVKDARSLAEELRREDFDVDERENANRETMRRAIDGFVAKIQPGSAALLYFGGF